MKLYAYIKALSDKPVTLDVHSGIRSKASKLRFS
jgi:hypothetical protein